jgi:hypothetical protein
MQRYFWNEFQFEHVLDAHQPCRVMCHWHHSPLKRSGGKFIKITILTSILSCLSKLPRTVGTGKLCKWLPLQLRIEMMDHKAKSLLNKLTMEKFHSESFPGQQIGEREKRKNGLLGRRPTNLHAHKCNYDL